MRYGRIGEIKIGLIAALDSAHRTCRDDRAIRQVQGGTRICRGGTGNNVYLALRQGDFATVQYVQRTTLLHLRAAAVSCLNDGVAQRRC